VLLLSFFQDFSEDFTIFNVLFLLDHCCSVIQQMHRIVRPETCRVNISVILTNCANLLVYTVVTESYCTEWEM